MSDPIDHRAGSPGEPMQDALHRALPDPPPPRPARRRMAIATALERFDGVDASALPSRPPPAPGRAPWWRTGRVQLGALASIALAAVIALPLALEHPDGAIDRPRAATITDVAPDTGKTAAEPAAAPPPAAKPLPRIVAPADMAPTRPTRSTNEARAPTPRLPLAAPIASIAPPSPPAPAPPPQAFAPVVAEARAKASGEMARAAPAAANDASDVVVTGSHISRRAAAAARRGDWNACTINDPDGALRGCGGLFRRQAKGSPGAADNLVQALAFARSSDWAGAIEALDRAIALQPRLGIAYLNRALVHERLGDADAAAADLDRAVRFDPSARSFYARARLRRERGEVRAARSDEEHAVDLDADYAKLIED